MTTAVFEIETTEVLQPETHLLEAAKNSGLELHKAQQYAIAFSPFMEEINQLIAKTATINKENPSTVDSKLAREVRLALAKKRVEADKLRAEKKDSFLKEGNLIQSLYNVIKSTSEFAESELSKVEKYAEIKEAERKATLKAERTEQLQPFNVDTTYVDLANMPDEQFEQFLATSKKMYEEKIEAERKAEEERKEKERIDNLHKERKDSVLHLWHYIPENSRDKHNAMNLGEMDEMSWTALVSILEQEKEDYETEQAAIKAENERLKKEAEEKEKAEKERSELRNNRQNVLKQYNYIHTGDLAELDDATYERLWNAAKESFDEAEKKRIADAENARIAKEKADAEVARLKALADKAEAELKAKQEAEAKAEADRIAKEEAEASKGDAAKMVDLQNELQAITTKYTFKSKKYKTIHTDINTMINKMQNHITGKL